MTVTRDLSMIDPSDRATFCRRNAIKRFLNEHGPANTNVIVTAVTGSKRAILSDLGEMVDVASWSPRRVRTGRSCTRFLLQVVPSKWFLHPL